MTEVIGAVFTLTFAAQLVRVVPYALAAMCGAVTERSGVIDLALEAKLLFGAFAAAAVAHATGSAYLGVVGAMMAGMLVAAVQLGCALRLGADQVIVGVGLNVLALAGTRFLLQLFYGESSNSPRVPGFGSAVATNPIVWLAVVAAIALPFALRRTRWGVRLRAAGDRPDALVAVGVSPTRARFAAGLVGGALAGAGGAQLTLKVNGFVADMSQGRGYMALAMVILAGWRPAWAVIACLGFAVVEAFGDQLQYVAPESLRAYLDLAPLLPYVMTVIVLIVFDGKRRRPPRALGQV